MQILILDDQLDKANGLAEDIAYLSDGQMHADVARTAAEAANLITQRRLDRLPAYGAMLIDQRLSDGERGIEVMQRLLNDSPESEALLFTANDDAQIGLRALQAGALHYFDRTKYSTDEILLRLNEIRIMHGFDEAVLRANKATTLNETAQMIVESGRLLGFERTRLWRCQFDISGKPTTFIGWAESGNIGLEDFSKVEMPVEEAHYVPRLLRYPHDVCVFETRSIAARQSSFLVSRFGHMGYTAPMGEWATLRLRWDDATRAVLMLDNAKHDGRTIDLNRQRLLLRFARSAASALARAAAVDEQIHLQAIAKHVVELIANKKVDEALKEIADQLCKADPIIASTKFIIVLKNEAAHTADCRCVCGIYKFEQPYRHNLARKLIVPYLISRVTYDPLLLESAEDIRLFHEEHGLQLDSKPMYSFAYVPLCVGGKTTGALVLNNDVDPDIHYSANQVDRLRRLALEIAAGIEAGRLREAAEWDSIRRDTLIKIRKALDDDIQFGADRHESWHLLLTALTAGQGIGFNRACLFLMDKSGTLVTETGEGHRTVKATRDVWRELDPNQLNQEARSTPFDLDVYRRVRAAPQGRTPLEAFAKLRYKFADCAVLNDAVNDIMQLSVEEAQAGLPEPFVKFVGATPCALIPVHAGEHVLGVVYVDNHAEENAITLESLEEARALLSYAAQTFQSQRKRAERIRLIELSNENFEDGASLKKNLQHICDEAMELTDADLVMIHPIEPDTEPDMTNSEGFNYNDHRFAIVAGNHSDKTTQTSPQNSPDGLTHYIRTKRELIARDVREFTESKFCGQSLALHPFIQEEQLQGLIGISLYDNERKSSFGVLYLGYRHPISDESHEKEQANFLKRIACRALRANWRRNNEKAIRGAEADAHREIMELSLKPDATVVEIAKLATAKMRELLGKERVDQESAVTLLRWKPATDTERAQQYRVDYRITAPEFVPHEINRLTDPNINNDKVYFGITGKALKQAEPVYIRDIVGDKDYHAYNPATRCELALRLTTTEDEPLGVLNVQNSTVGAFDEDLPDVVKILSRLADTLVNAIENTQRRVRNQTVLKALGAITTPFELQKTLRKIIEAAREIAESVTTVIIWYVDTDNPDRLFYENFGCLREMDYPIEPDESIRRIDAKYIDKILTSAEERFLLDARVQEPPSQYVLTHKIKSTIHLPLIIQEEGKEPDTVGVMFLNFLDRQVFTEEDKLLFRGLATIAAASIRDVNMAQKMGRDAFLSSHTMQVQDMAHDLNSQTGLMRSYVSRLMESNLSEEQQSWLGEIETELDEMIDGLPALHAKSDRKLYPVAIDAIRQIVQDTIMGEPKARGLNVEIELPANVIIFANRVLLKRALNHLLGNSLKPGLGTSRILIKGDVILPSKLRIMIADDGVGLTPEIEAHILRGPVWLPGEGGHLRPSMGLLYARNQVEAMGGTLKYLGKHHGRGAAFAMEFQLNDS